jgi:hypothetical protein
LFKHFIPFFQPSGWWYYQIENKLKAVVCQGKNYNNEIRIIFEMLHELSELEKQPYRKKVLVCYIYKQTTLKIFDVKHYDLKGATKKLAVSVRHTLDFIVWMLFFVSFSHNSFHRPLSIVRVHPQIVFDRDWH